MTDIMRQQTRDLTGPEIEAVHAVKGAGNAYVEVLKQFIHPGRELSLAITNAEQSVMWAVKGITG